MSDPMHTQSFFIVDTQDITKKVKLESQQEQTIDIKQNEQKVLPIISQVISENINPIKVEEPLKKPEIVLENEQQKQQAEEKKIAAVEKKKQPKIKKQTEKKIKPAIKKVKIPVVKVYEPSHQKHRFTEKFSILIEKLNLKPLNPEKPEKIIKPENPENTEDSESEEYSESDEPEYQPSKQPYSVLEDLLIVHFVMISECNPYSRNFWIEIEKKKLIARSSESMRDRYRKYLKFLNDENLQDIYDFIQTKGIQGFLEFQNENSKKKESPNQIIQQDIIQHNEPQKDKKFLVGIISVDQRMGRNKNF